ncbi:hypothetical protein [Longimicrobium sp.]|uniref:hypothetical protein n=1 Tax=Longimicrobium sp. TaxID=2029185 RepID=UPI003B3A1004
MPLHRLLLRAVLLLAAVVAHPRGAAAQPVQMCSNQPIPTGYVVTATSSRTECPGYYSSGPNSFTIRVPGDTVSVCTTLSPTLPGYVVTRQTSRSECPNYYSSNGNSATWQRVGEPPAAQPAAADDEILVMDAYDRTVFQRLGEMAAWRRLVMPTHHPWLSKAAHGVITGTTVTLTGGTRYTLVAVCDQDCTDLDLRVLDGGYLLGEDRSTDETAVVELAPARDVRLTVETIMAQCAQSPCHFAVGVYETPRPGAIPPRRPPGGDVRVTPRPRP